MKKFLVILLLPCYLLTANTHQTKDVQIIGPLIAPWVKGQLCASYWFEQKKIQQCFDIGAGKEYIVKDVPERINRIKITRSLEKTCAIKNKVKKCHIIKGNFYIKQPGLNTLNLTYDNVNITVDYTIPPKQPNSNYALPRRYPSARTPLADLAGSQDAFA